MAGHPITFHDGGWYCYANSTAMLLSAIGEEVSPRLIEVLSGVGLGAFVAPEAATAGGLPFFSSLAGPPDSGISRALTLLGFEFDEHASDGPGAAALAELSAVLAGSPAILGPLDMSLLSYNPGRPASPGIDHYVLAVRMEAGRTVVYDPAGFAEATIPVAGLDAAWRADAIGYRRGGYRYWTRPRRVARPGADALAAAAVVAFRRLYAEADRLAPAAGCLTDAAAIEYVAGLVRGSGLTPAQSGHLLRFALPLGAKRALDFATFFERLNPELVDLKRRQARLFGACHSNLARGEAPSAADSLVRLAGLESAIRKAIEDLPPAG
ncbi:hypothetical protein [Thalassobaculum sp.]|uniref:hypothetical protein n=1 Tax=Thalassobaculum sp. TaxID=2022740 RepID=UPI0032EF1496